MPPKPPPPKSANPPNRLTITDYNKSFLQPIIQKLKVGQRATINIVGEITRLEETDTGGGGYMCELGMEPSSARLIGSASDGGSSMTSQVKSIQNKKAGYEDTDEEEEDY
jgi:hypothetical protein